MGILHENHPFLVHFFVISIVAVHFLNSLLFPINGSYLNCDICLLSPTEWEGGEQLMVFFVVGVVNWRIPFLNYNIKSRGYFSHWRLEMG